MVSQAVDASLATIFYSITVLIIFSLFGCYMYDIYKKSRRGEYSTTRATATTATNSQTNPDTHSATSGNKKVPDSTLQLCVITLFDEPLIGTIHAINEDLEANSTLPTNIKNTSTAVADFGDNVIIELESNEDNETICPICLNEYESGDIVFRNDPKRCRHIFHKECILTWIQRNSPTPECPCCRSRIAVTKMMNYFKTSNTTSTVDCDVELPTITITTTTNTSSTGNAIADTSINRIPTLSAMEA